MAGAAGVAEAPQGQWLQQLDNELEGLLWLSTDGRLQQRATLAAGWALASHSFIPRDDPVQMPSSTSVAIQLPRPDH